MKVVAFVPIRLNSERVVGKNLKIFHNKPLMCYILETLVHVRGIDEVYVYCSSDEITAYLPDGVKYLRRPASLDSHETLGKQIYDAFTSAVDADVYLLAHATSPFITPATIERALELVVSGRYDSAFTARKLQTFAWFEGKPLNYDLCEIPRTQTIEPVYVETSAFYIFRHDTWCKEQRRIGHNPYMVLVDRFEGIEIDWPDDFDFAEHYVIPR